MIEGCGILCPKCSGEMDVKDSRPLDGYVKRRRICRNPHCSHAVTTFETIGEPTTHFIRGGQVYARPDGASPLSLEHAVTTARALLASLERAQAALGDPPPADTPVEP